MYADLRGVVGAEVDLSVFDDARSRVDELFSAKPTQLVYWALRSLGWHVRYPDPEESFRLHTQAAHVKGQLDDKHRGPATMAYIDHIRSVDVLRKRSPCSRRHIPRRPRPKV